MSHIMFYFLRRVKPVDLVKESYYVTILLSQFHLTLESTTQPNKTNLSCNNKYGVKVI